MATTDESLATENWPILRTFLPKGWKEMARETGALRRARDMPDAESLCAVGAATLERRATYFKSDS
jgi:hypothetical protein